MQSRPNLMMKYSAQWRFLPLIALIPFLITVAALGAAYFTGTPIDELTVPFVGMTAFSLVVGGMLALIAFGSWMMERSRINGLYDAPWVAWTQFTPQGW